MTEIDPAAATRLWRNVQLATFDPAFDPAVGLSQAETGGAEQPFAGYGAVTDGALLEQGGRIVWLGHERDLPPGVSSASVVETVDGQGGWLLPGFIDCHTHIVFAGQRAGEFEQRLKGASYQQIAAAGGGIRTTVRATRDASEQQLLALARPRLRALAREGVTGVEIKSGYGLELEAERRQLQVATRLATESGLRVQRTFLGAHTLPPEFEGRADDYIDLICRQWLPELAAAGLVDAVDAFCETVGFSPAQVRRLFTTARQLGLPLRLHAEQLSDQGGAALAAGFGALSADHLEYLSPAGIEAMRQAGTTAVLLPAAYYFLRQQQPPPVEALRQAGVPLAIASDANPGSAPFFSLRWSLSMACSQWGLTPAEALAGVTRNAARALGWQGEQGTLSVGKRADLVLWPVETPAELVYQMGALDPLRISLAEPTAEPVDTADD